MNRLRALAAGVLACATFLGAPALAEETGPIKIGFAIAESGWLSTYDAPAFKAAILKIDQINAAGGLLGRKIEYEVVDTKSEQAKAATAGAQLVKSGVNLLVFSCDYDFGAPAALAANRAGVISIGLCGGDPKMGVQGIGPFAFSSHSAAQTEGIAIAEYGYKKMGLKTAYVLEDTTIEYNKSACAGFRAGWINQGGPDSLVGNDTFKNDDPSIATQITRIKNMSPQPDAIYICSYAPGGVSAVRQLRAAGIDQPIFAATAMSDNYWLDAVPGLKDFYVAGIMSLYGDDPRPEINAYLDAFKARWGELPASSFSICGYTLVEEWTYAVDKTGTTAADKVLAMMNSYKDQPFTMGPTTFTDQLHIQIDRPWLIMGVKDGSFHAVEMYRNELKPDMKLLFRVGQN